MRSSHIYELPDITKISTVHQRITLRVALYGHRMPCQSADALKSFVQNLWQKIHQDC